MSQLLCSLFKEERAIISDYSTEEQELIINHIVTVYRRCGRDFFSSEEEGGIREGNINSLVKKIKLIKEKENINCVKKALKLVNF